MAMPIGLNIHGTPTDNPVLKALLHLGNLMRYGMSEDERQAEVYGLKAPGVEDVATTNGQFDPAATERYTSALRFGERFTPPDWLQPALHSISSGSRAKMNSIPLLAETFGVGEERPELVRAEELGMSRGAKAVSGPSLEEALMKLYLQGKQGGY